MERNIYYGEYTLKYWVKLMLKGNIRLPKYQRYFVWSKERVQKLVDSINDNLFVPPVTIGLFKENDNAVNYILDGQQRLTSILLAYLGLFPKSEKEIKDTMQRYADENDNDMDDDIYENVLDWTFAKLTSKGKSKEEILAEYDKRLYDEVNYKCSNVFFENKFLGFTFIVPNIDKEEEQQKFYSSVFRNINQQGVTLLPIESRRALYYLRSDLNELFEPDFDEIRVNHYNKVDFVRYLSLLFQYHKCKKESEVSKSYPYKRAEEYYESFIYSVVGDNTLDMFVEFKSVFPNGQYANELKELIDTIKEVMPKDIPSIIDLDMFMFGATYQILFEKKRIDLAKQDELKKEINEAVEKMKGDEKHKKNPSYLQFLRSRLKSSLEIYAKYSVAP